MSGPETADAPGIAAHDLSVTYRNGLTALSDATFAVPVGSITALVGMNGAGKSTLFKAIMGFAPVSGGTISVLGMTARQAVKRRKIAYVPQSEEVDWDFPVLVEDVVMMGRYGHMNWLRIAGREDHQAVGRALQRVGMADLRKRQIGELSGGQRKRVFLARALAQDAQVVLLDEPFTGIDVTTELAIMELLRGLRAEGRIVLVSTHNLGSVPEFCDRAILINRTVLADGPTAEAFTHENLERAFGGVLRHVVLDGSTGRDAGSAIGVLTDDERPFILFGGKGRP